MSDVGFMKKFCFFTEIWRGEKISKRVVYEFCGEAKNMKNNILG